MKSSFDDDGSRFNDETRLFRRFVNPDGSLGSIDEFKQNGHGVPRQSAIEMEGDEKPHFELSALLATYRVVMTGLNRFEPRLWGMLLKGISLNRAAAIFGLSRQALYSRLRGDKKGIQRHDRQEQSRPSVVGWPPRDFVNRETPPRAEIRT